MQTIPALDARPGSDRHPKPTALRATVRTPIRSRIAAVPATPMTLYCVAGDASQAPHILLHEAGLPFEAVGVDPHAQRIDTGEDYLAINPTGLIPALATAGGTITGVPAILQYIAERVPQRRLIPAAGSAGYYTALSWLSFIGDELHVPFLSVFDHAPGDVPAQAVTRLCSRINHVDRALHGRAYLLGDDFTAPDAYLFVVAGWLRFIGLELERWPNLNAFHRRVAERPAVRTTLAAEGFGRGDLASTPSGRAMGGSSVSPAS